MEYLAKKFYCLLLQHQNLVCRTINRTFIFQLKIRERICLNSTLIRVKMRDKLKFTTGWRNTTLQKFPALSL